MGFIKNKDNERYMLFLGSIEHDPKCWEYPWFISDMVELYRKSKNHKGFIYNFRISNQDNFTDFIKKVLNDRK